MNLRRALLGTMLLCAAAAPAAHASPTQESTFQDDSLLVYGEPQTVASTLDTLKALGVDRLRISVFWRIVAPAHTEPQRPDFDATDPAAYPHGAWDRYDRLLREAQARGLRVNLNLTGPSPNWATGTPEREDIDETYEPSAEEFGRFTQAVARRYSGQYAGPDGQALPRVDYWTIWNEPNHAGWLTPQWAPDPRDGATPVEAAPRLYRGLVDAAWDALAATDHGSDTILIGETAPKGLRITGTTRSMSPGRFIRRLYCVSDALRPLQGAEAEVHGCPPSGDPAELAREHPALLGATGWAHHPYELTFAPSRRPRDRDWFTTGNLGELSKLLRRIRKLHGRGGTPLYLTEFGYQTDPPDPMGVSQGRQAAYLDEAEYLTWRNRSVRTLGQFLLVDDRPLDNQPAGSTAAWGSTFQSGLVMLDGREKPAFRSYQLAVHLPRTSVRRGTPVRVWGLARAATSRSRVQVLLRSSGHRRYRVVRRLRPSRHGYVQARIRTRRSGRIRLRYRNPAGTLVTSRAVSFRVRRR